MLSEMLIGQVAQSTGLSIDRSRFYEKQALVPHPQRTPARYRVYDEQDVERLRFISRAQNLGFSLQEVWDSWRLRLTMETVAPMCETWWRQRSFK